MDQTACSFLYISVEFARSTGLHVEPRPAWPSSAARLPAAAPPWLPATGAAPAARETGRATLFGQSRRVSPNSANPAPLLKWPFTFSAGYLMPRVPCCLRGVVQFAGLLSDFGCPARRGRQGNEEGLSPACAHIPPGAHSAPRPNCARLVGLTRRHTGTCLPAVDEVKRRCPSAFPRLSTHSTERSVWGAGR